MSVTMRGTSTAWLALGLVACGQDSRTIAHLEPIPRASVASPGLEPAPNDTSTPSDLTPDAGMDAGMDAGSPTQPPGWDQDLALAVPEDLDPDPDVLEVAIEAREAAVEILPGISTTLWTYDGVLPGPLLRAKRGDRLIVHFTNQLPDATTVHWHGVRVPSTMDGSLAVQEPIQPGESFTYDFTLPDAGTYWYHPHVDSATQVGNGLYGALVIDDPDDPLPADDLVLVLSDMSLDDDGALQPGDLSGWFGDYFGREGQYVLVNGKIRPRLLGTAGLPQRWHIINAARSRFFQLALPQVPLVRIGGDGGLIEHPLPIEALRLAPSERAELWVVPPATTSGVVEVLREDADRFNIGIPQPPEILFEFQVLEGAGAPPDDLPAVLRSLAPLDLGNAKPRRIEFGEVVVDGDSYLTINGHAHGLESDAGTEHDHGAAHVAFVGDTEIWEIVNTTEYDHPFHLHGFSFEVLESGGAPWPVREWKDTVDVPAEQSVKFALEYDDRPGTWMFHCHILDHAKLGMMAELEVQRLSPPTATSPTSPSGASANAVPSPPP